MEMIKVTVGELAENCYILCDEARHDCVLIDPGAEAARIRQATEGRQIAAILLTHGHFDHIGAVRELMSPETVLVIHRDDAPLLADPVLNAAWLMGMETTAPPATRTVVEGDTLDYAGLRFTVLHTPGHTAGSVCYDTGEALFTGDTVMAHGIGRTDLPTGDDAAMQRSLRRLLPLLHTKTIYGGHG